MRRVEASPTLRLRAWLRASAVPGVIAAGLALSALAPRQSPSPQTPTPQTPTPQTPPAESAPAPATLGSWKLATPAPHVALKPARLAGADSLDCARCHAAVVDEWASTAHALAWVDEQYQEQLADVKKPEGCHACHVPQPLFLQKDPAAKPPARADVREHGIRCESCHLGEGGALLGPRGATTSAHATKQSDAFVGAGSNALCSSCHRTTIGPVVGLAKDFEQSKQAERGRSCVGCHLADVELEFTKLPAGEKAAEGAPPGQRAGKSHLLQTPRDPAFLRRAFELRLAERNGQSVLEILNQAGHRVPGLHGRKLVFTARARDASGKELAPQMLTIDVGAYLAVDGMRELPLGARVTSVRVTGTHDEPRADGPVTFFDETLER